MPYIKANRRSDLRPASAETPDNAGELNYVFTMIVKEYFETHKNYQGINDIVGALEGCKLEFYRRVVAPYEDEKIATNGDVF